MVKRIIIFLAFILVIALGIYGIRGGDFTEVQVHGSVMCLSCMGIE